MSYLNMF